MSFDEDLENDISELLLINILKSREDSVSTSELWAILKETCVALQSLANDIDIAYVKFDINCLLIDTFGNIQINIDSGTLHDNTIQHCRNSTIINSIGETLMYIILNYCNIDSSENIYRYVLQLMNATPTDAVNLFNIELYADRQLNGNSTSSILSKEFVNYTKPNDTSSAFQDSFVSTEYSLNTDPESDSDQSLCLTKEQDTLSNDIISVSSTDSELSFLSLNQLWSHCKDCILSTDQECLGLIYAILKQVCNSLLNENNSKICLCISVDNILLDEKGRIYINFSSDSCAQCLNDKHNPDTYDFKYINTIGNIIYNVILSDRRISISGYILIMLQRMINSKDLIIHDVLCFCKTNITLQGTRFRSILIRLFEKWRHWHKLYLNYLGRLKHRYLYDISTINLKPFLKNICTKSPMTVQEMFQQNHHCLSGLKYVTKLCPSTPSSKRSTYPYSIGQVHSSSAFQAYQPQNVFRVATLYNSKPSRMKDTTHFRPLILTSECNSVYQSHDNLLSPIDVLPKYSKLVHCRSYNQSEMPAISQKTWQSVLYLPNHDINRPVHRTGSKNQLLCNRSIYNSQSNTSQYLSQTNCNRSLKINTLIDIIQSNITTNSDDSNNVQVERFILTVADFALSLETITENIFYESMKQRFNVIPWSTESLQLLYDTVNCKLTNLIESKVFINGNDIQATNKSPQDNNMDDLFNEVQDHESLSKESDESHDANNDNDEIPTNNLCEVKKTITVKPYRSKKERVRVVKTNNIEKNSSDVSERLFSESDSNCSKSEASQTPKPVIDASFYEIMYPCNLLCFPATSTILGSDRNPVIDFSVNANNIQDLINKFFNNNQSVQFKFKELTKTINLIKKCADNNSKKLKKQYYNDQKDLTKNLELLFISQIELESLIVEYHSVNIDQILEEIRSHGFNQSIRFSNECRNFCNLQMVDPYALVVCLFCKGAITSGLVYDFFVIYREFYTPLEFASVLSSVFINLQRRLVNKYWQLINCKFRLLFLIMCWIDGFYHIDFSDLVYSQVMIIVKKNIMPFLKNCDQIIEKTVIRAKKETTAQLLFQFITIKDGNSKKVELIRNVDIESIINSVDHNHKEKFKLFSWLNISFDKPKRTKNQDVLTILDFSSKDVAICLTLMEQSLFNNIHPCHLLLYLHSLSSTEKSILQSIKSHRFSPNLFINLNTPHKEVLTILRHSGKITHWAISEILKTTDFKLQGKIVKILVVTCIWCIELNNYATIISILEAIHSITLKWAPFWSHLKPKTRRILKELDDLTNQFSRNTLNSSMNNTKSSNSILTGSPFLPCLHTILMNLKLTTVGKTVTKDGCLKWNKLKKVSNILDQIRLYLQFKYASNNPEIDNLKKKLSARIDHLTSISLDILQSHNMLAQSS